MHTKLAVNQVYTMEALVIGHSRDVKKLSVTGDNCIFTVM